MAQWTTQLKSTLWPTASSKAAPPDSLLNDTDEDSTRQHSSSSSPLTLGSSFSPSPASSSPATPLQNIYQTNMQTTSPINIATPARNASSSPSSQGMKIANYHGAEDSRRSAMMSGGGLDNTGRNREDSFGAAKPISMNIPNRNTDSRPRRESLAGSLVGGMSWGGVSVGSWIRDE
jgi:transcription factor SFP1